VMSVEDTVAEINSRAISFALMRMSRTECNISRTTQQLESIMLYHELFITFLLITAA
jgi:hypothetical protein